MTDDRSLLEPLLEPRPAAAVIEELKAVYWMKALPIGSRRLTDMDIVHIEGGHRVGRLQHLWSFLRGALLAAWPLPGRRRLCLEHGTAPMPNASTPRTSP